MARTKESEDSCGTLRSRRSVIASCSSLLWLQLNFFAICLMCLRDVDDIICEGRNNPGRGHLVHPSSQVLSCRWRCVSCWAASLLNISVICKKVLGGVAFNGLLHLLVGKIGPIDDLGLDPLPQVPPSDWRRAVRSGKKDWWFDDNNSGGDFKLSVLGLTTIFWEEISNCLCRCYLYWWYHIRSSRIF